MKPPPSQPAPEPARSGHESVWDYPRPAVMENCRARLRVELDGIVVADTVDGFRVLETSHPPSYYLPPADCDDALFSAGSGSSFCEWKGHARYWTVRAGAAVIENGAWSYPSPSRSFVELQDHRAFYPHLFACFVDDEQARAQAGGFYGGWITSTLAGPFKGEPGTHWW